ncbi:polysaccharide lyase [Actinomycetospora succinea]|uniref:polysaccharide lyase n=1 Tax=Actinomycetospora succinea TaxID=663603 RepID=UPI001AAD5934|nr:polysaccharide lyase [Actinomycetospora succinea]
MPAPLLAVVTALLAVLPTLLGSAPAAAAAPPPANDRPVFELPTSGDLLGAFDRNGYNEQDGAPRAIPSPTSPGRQALEFRLDGGDQRSEVEPRVPDQYEGQVWYYTYRAGLAEDFPTDTEDWQVVLQWHHTGDSGSPPVALEVKQGRLALASEGENLQDLGPIRGGDRIDVSMRVAFSQDPERGSVDVWRDGRHVLDGYRPPNGTLLDQGNYLKLGLYRATRIDEGGRLWVDDLRVGPTMASVAPTGMGSGTAGGDPVAEDAAAPAGPADIAAERDVDTVTWVAGALLLGVVVLLVATRSARRAPAPRDPGPREPARR